MKIICISKKTKKNYSWPEMKDETETYYFSSDKIEYICHRRRKNHVDLPQPEEVHHVYIKLSFLPMCIEGYTFLNNIFDLINFIDVDEANKGIGVLRIDESEENLRHEGL